MKKIGFIIICCVVVSCDRYRVGPISVSQKDIDRAVDAVENLSNDNYGDDNESDETYISRTTSPLVKYGFSDLEEKGNYKLVEYLGTCETWPNGVSDSDFKVDCDAYLISYKGCNVKMRDCSNVYDGKPFRVWTTIDSDESGCNVGGCECWYYQHRGQFIAKCDECGHDLDKHWPKK